MKNTVTLSHATCLNLSKLLTENGVVTYISLKALYNPSYEGQWLTLNSINRVLKPNNKLTNTSQKEDLRNGLSELQENNLIEILETDKTEYYIDMSGLYVNGEEEITRAEYTNSPFDNPKEKKETKRKVNNYFTPFDINKLVQAYKDNDYKKRIFKYLLCYLGWKVENVNNPGESQELSFFLKSREDMSEDSEIDVRTIDNYNDILMKNEIIYIYKYNHKWSDSGKQLPNANGLFKDKDYIEKKAKEFLDSNKNEIVYSPIIKTKEKKKEDSLTKKEQVTTKVEPIKGKKVSSSSGGFGRRESKLVNPKVEEKTVNEKQISDGKIPVVSDKDIFTKKESTIKQNEELNNSDDFWKRTEPNKENKYIYDWKSSMKKAGMIPTTINKPEEPKHINIAELI